MVVSKRLWLNDIYYTEFRVKENLVTMCIYKDGFEYPCMVAKFAICRDIDDGSRNVIYMHTIDNLMECVNKIVHIIHLNLNHKEHRDAV